MLENQTVPSEVSMRLSVQPMKNYMEIIVEETLDEWVRKGESFCNCPRCRMDVIAFSLNRLPARYVVTKDGETYTQFNSLYLQTQAEVMEKVLEAIRAISAKPRHS